MKQFHLSMGLALSIGGLLLAGCGDGPSPNASQEQDRLKLAQTYRGFFDKANGDLAQLPQADRAKLNELAGGEAKAQVIWAQMKGGPGAKP